MLNGWIFSGKFRFRIRVFMLNDHREFLLNEDFVAQRFERQSAPN